MAMNILHMSISAGLLITVIVIIRAVALNRLPKTMFLILWGVTLCRLLIPVSVPLKYSVYSVINAIIKIAFPDTPVQSAIDHALSTGGPAGAQSITGQITQTAQEQVLTMAPATVVWLVGMLAAFVVFAILCFKNYRELRFALMIRDDDFLNKWLAEHRLLRPMTILQSDRITTPVAVGVVKPRIILPKSMNMSDEQLLNHVLTHEYYHIKRCDVLWKLLCVFALCVHWFNPMVWVMFALVNRDLELTCDEMVIRRFGAETKTAYAYSLIGMAEQRSKLAPLYNGFGKNAAEERIIAIMKTKKASFISAISAVALVSVLTVGVMVTSAAATPANAVRADGFSLAAMPTGNGIEKSDAPFSANMQGFKNNWEYLHNLGFLVYDNTSFYQPLYRFDDKWVSVIYDPYVWNGIDYSGVAQFEGSGQFGESTGVRVIRDALSGKITGLSEMTVGEIEEVTAARGIEVMEEQEKQNPLPQYTEHIEYNTDTDNDVYMPLGSLISVSSSDKDKFTEKEWKDILAKIEKGEIRWED
jgi:beta-lactamase regulating signal transducer with metallopeptidase domain